jgi:hypothetical protein
MIRGLALIPVTEKEVSASVQSTSILDNEAPAAAAAAAAEVAEVWNARAVSFCTKNEKDF